MSWFTLDERNGVVYALVMLTVVIVLQPLRRRRSARLVASMAFEIGLVCALFSLWQLANHVTRGHTSGGLSRGREIWHDERAWHLPSELSVQHLIIGHPDLVRPINLYYDTAHLTVMGVFLAWLWFRHRDRYPQVRNALALLTLVSLLVQMVSVAPPRLIGIHGLVDTAQAYGQSVYAAFGSGIADEYAAFPSLHVAWAFLISAAVLTCSTSRWRWVFALYGPVTTFVVVATANHYWADGIAAVVLLVAAWWASRAIEPFRLALRRRLPFDTRPVTIGAPRPVPAGPLDALPVAAQIQQRASS